MKLVFATGNRGKLSEAQEILGPEYELVTPSDLGIDDDVEETGSTLSENSLIKAKSIHEATGLDCFADDTGLEVDCLGGAPGVFTARYAGPDCNFDDNMEKLLSEMAKAGGPRTARFRCVVTLIRGGEVRQFDGCLEGEIALRREGRQGFGYDPVFIPREYPDRTLAEISASQKNAISHRGEALRLMAKYLKAEE